MIKFKIYNFIEKKNNYSSRGFQVENGYLQQMDCSHYRVYYCFWDIFFSFSPHDKHKKRLFSNTESALHSYRCAERTSRRKFVAKKMKTRKKLLISKKPVLSSVKCFRTLKGAVSLENKFRMETKITSLLCTCFLLKQK